MKFDFILDNMCFSYSSVSTFITCPYGFSLTYIEYEERINNAFSDYGLLVHETLERFFRGELPKDELVDYYKVNWPLFLKSEWPQIPQGMEDNYYKAGVEFFETFDFDLEKYEVIFIEEAVYSEYRGIKLVVKPDLILREKSTGKYILVDYKTAKIKGTKAQKKKQIEDYLKQFYLYIQFLWWEKEIAVDEIQIWFIRDRVKEIIAVNQLDIADVLTWFEDTISKIKNEEEWKPNLDKSNEYFCFNICSMRSICKYRN